MRRGTVRAIIKWVSCQVCNGLIVMSLLVVCAGDAAAQRLPRRPQRPARPGMNQGATGGNAAGRAPAANAARNGNDSSGVIRNLADPNAPAPELWKVKPDPAAEQPPEITQEISLRVPPSFFGGEVVYPTAPSVFVAVGRNGDQKDVREIWDLANRKRVGSLRGGAKLDKPYALSADGSLFAGKSDRSFTVYETKTARLLAQLPVDSPFADYVDFAGDGQLVTGTSGDRRFEVWDLKTQKSETDISPRERVDKESVILSPGRHYLAMVGERAGTFWVYDVQSGRKVGEAPVPKNNNFDLNCKALAFSPDGAELAGVFDSFGTHLLCWDVATGRLTHQFKYDDKSGIKARPGIRRHRLELAHRQVRLAAFWLDRDRPFVRTEDLHHPQRHARRGQGAAEGPRQEPGAHHRRRSSEPRRP